MQPTRLRMSSPFTDCQVELQKGHFVLVWLIFQLHLIDSWFVCSSQVENTDLSTGITPVTSCDENVRNLLAEAKYSDIWNEVITQIDAPSKRIRRADALLQNYVVEETTGNNEINEHEMRRSFCSTSDHVVNEMNCCFSQRNLNTEKDFLGKENDIRYRYHKYIYCINTASHK